MMNITLFGFIAGLLLLIVPVYCLITYRVNFSVKLLRGLLTMVAGLSVSGLILYYILKINSQAVTLLGGFLFMIAAVFLTLGRAKVKATRLFLPLLVGVVSSSLVLALFLLFVVLGQKNPFEARWFIPMIGLLTGNMIGTVAKSLDVYNMGLKNHGQLFYYLLGNGATRHQAQRYLLRRSVQQVSTINLRNMGYMFFGVSPIVMWVMVMNGCDVVTSAGFQVIIVVSQFAASMLCVWITLLMAQKYLLDDYARLKGKGENIG